MPYITEKTRKAVNEILDAASRVISNSDDTGCNGDLTVTSKSAVDKLNELISNWPRE